MYKEIECPYCGHEFDLNHDDGAYYNEVEREECQCPGCEKYFMVSSSVSWDYEGEKADCLNEGEHDWVKMFGHPEEYYIGMFRCRACGEEESREPEKRQEALNELYK